MWAKHANYITHNENDACKIIYYVKRETFYLCHNHNIFKQTYHMPSSHVHPALPATNREAGLGGMLEECNVKYLS